MILTGQWWGWQGDTSNVTWPDTGDISQQKCQRLSSENNIVTYENAIN